MAARVRKVMTQPINLIFRFLQNVRSYRVLVRGAVLVHVPSAWPACVCTCNAPPIARPCACLLLCACGVLRDVLMGWDTLLTLPVRVQKTRIQIWLYEQTSIRMEGRIIVRVWPRSVLLALASSVAFDRAVALTCVVSRCCLVRICTTGLR